MVLGGEPPGRVGRRRIFPRGWEAYRAPPSLVFCARLPSQLDGGVMNRRSGGDQPRGRARNERGGAGAPKAGGGRSGGTSRGRSTTGGAKGSGSGRSSAGGTRSGAAQGSGRGGSTSTGGT